MFGLRVKDVNFAMKIFRRTMLRSISLRSEGAFINAEFLAKARKCGYSIKEVPIEYTLRSYGVSTLSKSGVIIKVLSEMIRYFPEIYFYSPNKLL